MDDADVKLVSCRTNNPSNGFDANQVFTCSAENKVRASQGKNTSRITVTHTIPSVPNRSCCCLVIVVDDVNNGVDSEEEEEEENMGSRAL